MGSQHNVRAVRPDDVIIGRRIIATTSLGGKEGKKGSANKGKKKRPRFETSPTPSPPKDKGANMQESHVTKDTCMALHKTQSEEGEIHDVTLCGVGREELREGNNDSR